MQRLPHRVQVPASTSNLGPGFDCLGAALSLMLEVRVVADSDRHRFGKLEGEAACWPEEDNLLLRAFDLARGSESGGFVFEATSGIPVSRGLGSSAAAVVAGLLLGDAFADAPSSREQLLELGLELEGHPDNVAPCLLGGCRLSVPLAQGLRVIEQPVHPSIGWAVSWPDAQVSTQEARAALPDEVSFQDAVENPRRLSLLLEGLRTGDGELLRLGVEDRLHTAHRLALVPGAERVLDAALEAGAHAAFVSGSGSAQVALTPKDVAGEVAEATAQAWRQLGGEGTGVVATLVESAPAPA